MSPRGFSLCFVTVICVIFAFSGSTSAQKSKAAIIDIKAKLLFNVSVMRNQKKPFVVFYYSTSECGPCTTSLLPMLQNTVMRKGEFVNLATVDFDKVPELREEHGISKVPTTKVYFKGEVMDSVEGSSWSSIVAMVNRATKLG